MLPIAFWVESWGGLAGGEAKSADCSWVRGGCDESQEKADGINMIVGVEVQRRLEELLSSIRKEENVRCCVWGRRAE